MQRAECGRGTGGLAAKRVRGPSAVEGDQTVTQWLQRYVKPMTAPWAEDSWPKCLVLDSTSFVSTNRRTGLSTELSRVMAAYGYPDDLGGRARVWALGAYPHGRASDGMGLANFGLGESSSEP